MILRWSHVLTVAVVLLVAADVRADTSRVDAAQRAYDELRFGDVLDEVAAARRKGALSHADAVELTRLEAYTYAVFEDADHAIDAFRRLLTLEPSFTPQGVSPKIRGYFEQARRSRSDATSSTTVAHAADREPARRSFVRSPWFWGGAAAVIVTGIGVALFIGQDDSQPGNLGTLALP